MDYTYRLQVEKGHILFNNGDGLILVDTGSSTSIHKDRKIDINGNKYSVQDNYLGMVSPEYLSKKVGVEISGLLGMDIMHKLPTLIDIPHQTISFGEKFNILNIGAGSCMGIPLIKLEVDGKERKLILDTGAWISYLDSSITNGFDVVRVERDFSPLNLGVADEFDTPIFKIETRIGNDYYKLEYGNLPFLLNRAILLTGAEGIIGYALLSRKAIYIHGGEVGVITT